MKVTLNLCDVWPTPDHNEKKPALAFDVQMKQNIARCRNPGEKKTIVRKISNIPQVTENGFSAHTQKGQNYVDSV